ncbi:MFS transporter [Nocardioides sambongensis]|uniref:MFS transporter n=1 Tax=Nocardioides sambongensis TaxID=2589074 RepID=UPI001E568D8D|nr:MFS transporter [Nocardioides sambongensis]
MLGIVSLVTDISSESVAAILPLYLTAVVGLSSISYGFIDTLYQGVSALVRIGGGWAADRGGHPKWVALLGYGTSTVARFFLLFSTGLAAISAVISADRIGKGIRTAPRDAMISSATAKEDLGYAFGVHRALDTTGAALGPLIAFAILWWIPDGYLTVMVVSFGFAVLGVALLGLFVEDRGTAEPKPIRSSVNWRQVARPGMTRLLAVAGVLGLLTVGDGFIYLALLDRGGFAAHWFPLLYVGTNVAFLALAIPIGRLADRVGKARVLIGGHLALLGAYVIVAAPIDLAASTMASLFLLGLFYAATDGVIAALASRLVAPEVRASGIASAQTVVAVARMGSSAIFGVLWFLLGAQAALLGVGVVLALVLPIASSSIRSLDRAAEVTP